MAQKMSPHQLDLLRSLAGGPRNDITDECVVKALARRGYAERHVPDFGHLKNRHQWRITEAGREALAPSLPRDGRS